jgi:hypothetical protein
MLDDLRRPELSDRPENLILDRGRLLVRAPAKSPEGVSDAPVAHDPKMLAECCVFERTKGAAAGREV